MSSTGGSKAAFNMKLDPVQEMVGPLLLWVILIGKICLYWGAWLPPLGVNITYEIEQPSVLSPLGLPEGSTGNQVVTESSHQSI